MTKIEFYLSDEDMNRLWYLKAKSDPDEHFTGNEYARELIESKLFELCPKATD